MNGTLLQRQSERERVETSGTSSGSLETHRRGAQKAALYGSKYQNLEDDDRPNGRSLWRALTIVLDDDDDEDYDADNNVSKFANNNYYIEMAG